jgi:zinc transporter 1/2/3
LNESAREYLVTQGVLDGLCGGILIYDGLVNIVIPHFNGNNYRHSTPGKKAVHVISLMMGSFLMAIVALWA